MLLVPNLSTTSECESTPMRFTLCPAELPLRENSISEDEGGRGVGLVQKGSGEASPLREKNKYTVRFVFAARPQ